MKRALIYDIECLKNLFTITFKDFQTKIVYKFVIHKLWNQYEDLIEFLLKEKTVLIGFNNESYDYPVLHHLLNHVDEYKKLSAEEITKRVYAKSQEIINMEFSAIADKNKFIQQIDLYKIHHLDNQARRCSC